MRQIGAIEERIMQFIMAKILEETDSAPTPNSSETLRRLRRYQGRREQHVPTSPTQSSIEPPSALTSDGMHFLQRGKDDNDDDDDDDDDDDIDDPTKEVAVVHSDVFRRKFSGLSTVDHSDGNATANGSRPVVRPTATSRRFASILSDSDSDSDSDVKLEETLSSLLSGPKDVTPTRKKPKTTPPKSASEKAKVRSHSTTDFLSTPERPRKRRSSAGAPLHGPTGGNGAALKPWTPSSAIKSSMNASLVFDMVTSLSTNDPGVAIATLRSIVVLGKEYPSDLLYVELIDRIQSPEAVAYSDAVAIYAALVFVFDKAASCSCAVTFPSQWDPLATALQDVSGNGRVGEDGRPKLDEHWRRNLLVVQFYIYCFQQDLHACRSRYENLEQHAWVYRTRLFSLLQNDASASSTSAKARAKARTSVGRTRNNNLMLQAIGWAVQLWKRVYDGNNKSSTKKSSSAGKMGDTSLFLQQEGEQACLAVLRLIEMLFLCTDQQGNALQRIQAGLMELAQPTRVKFAQAVQSPALRAQLATTMIGLSNKSRSKETEWYECNAMGRVLQAMNPALKSGLTFFGVTSSS
ncbi:hypothetical protein BBJ28_00019225 [Nothophytophthora sp. Chile5]|nr:hypothetical protein BBJ28_00019225 [Nothophytophthora sp. Chile5]